MTRERAFGKVGFSAPEMTILNSGLPATAEAGDNEIPGGGGLDGGPVGGGALNGLDVLPPQPNAISPIKATLAVSRAVEVLRVMRTPALDRSHE